MLLQSRLWKGGQLIEQETSSPFVTIKPACGSRPTVPHTVAAAGRNKNFVARSKHDARAFHFKFNLSLFDHHALVRLMHKVKPLTSRRVNPEIASEPVPGPNLGNALLVKRSTFQPMLDLNLGHEGIPLRLL